MDQDLWRGPVSNEKGDVHGRPSSLGSSAGGNRIGLALSGGGIRAAVFHLGVLRRLASERLMEDVSAVSTVSGGGLATAAIFSEAGMKWPTSDAYLGSVYPKLRQLITAADLLASNRSD